MPDLRGLQDLAQDNQCGGVDMGGSNDSVYVCVIVFASVFLPYIFLSTFIRTPKPDATDLASRNLPPLFRAMWRPLQLFVEALGRPLSNLQPGRAAKLANDIKVAGIRMAPEHTLSLELVLSLTLAVAFTLLALALTRDVGKICAVFLVCGFVGFVIPSTVVADAAKARQSAMMKALPFAIDLIGSAMRSGVDFNAAVRYYVANEDKTAPLAVEFAVMLRELELGKTRTDALLEMSDRIRNDRFSAFADAVVHGLEIGASIVGTMKVQAEELRRARFNDAERRAARAVSSMIFPIAVFIMPAMFLIIGTPILIRVFSSGLGGILK